MIKKLILCLLPLFAVGAAALLPGCTQRQECVIILAALLLLAFIAAVLLLKRLINDSRLRSVFPEGSAFMALLEGTGAAFCLLDSEGKKLWASSAFSRICAGDDIRAVLPRFDPIQPEPELETEVDGLTYEVKTATAGDGSSLLILQCWHDATELRETRRQYEEILPAIGYVYIDNYEEAAVSSSPETLSRADGLICSFADSLGGFARRYEPGKYIIVMSVHMLSRAQSMKFQLLDSVRELKTERGTPFSLSIAVGTADELKEAVARAKQAIELAIGRGGDQAVVKTETQLLYYGGKRQSAIRHSKVKSRVLSRSLCDLIAQSDRVFVMGHSAADMDALGAAIGMARLAKTLNKQVSIILDHASSMVSGFLDEYRKDTGTDALFIRPDDPRVIGGQKTLVIVVDTQRREGTPAPRLIDDAGMLFVLDHHRKSENAITSATLAYTEPLASSASELATELIQYFVPEPALTERESGMLLAGIALDTKNFTFNTGERTFEAAAFLRRHGAQAAQMQQLFQVDIETFKQRSRVVASAELITDDIALAICPKDTQRAELLTAQSADALTTIKGVKAAFVIAEVPDGVIISARSAGEINVQLIAETLGGGGHINMAGARLAGVSAEQARQAVIEAVAKYVVNE